MEPLLVLVEGEPSVWTYGKRGAAGALRLILVWYLLTFPDHAIIELYEWKDIHLKFQPRDSKHRSRREQRKTKRKSKQGRIPRYAAISHVWKPSENAAEIREEKDRPLRVDVGGSTHIISWFGLVQAAVAAAELDCDYLWLDLLCLDQCSDEDKKLQVKNMSKIYGSAAAVIVMVGGVVAAQRLDRPSTWINRAWTFQEATLCQENSWVLLHWDLPGSFKGEEISFRKLDKDIAIVRLEELVHCTPGEGFGIGQLEARGRKCEIELEYLFRCLGDDQVTLDALAAALDSIPVESDVDSTEYGDDDFEGYDRYDGSSSYAAKEVRDPLDDTYGDSSIYERAPSVTHSDDQLDGGLDTYGDSHSDSQPEDEIDFDFHITDRSDRSDRSSSETSASSKHREEFTQMIHQCAVWRSMWLRTSTKPQDMVFSMMHFFSVSIKVDYSRTLEDLVFELIETTPIPAWLAMGFDTPVDPRSGLIPILPQFTPNSNPFYVMDGNAHPASNLLCSEYYCSKFDIVIKSTSLDGHRICAQIMEVKWSTTPIKNLPDSSFIESELHLAISDVELDINCRFKGGLGTLMVVLGTLHRRQKEPLFYSSEGYPWIIFLERDETGSWQKVGGGILDEPLFSNKCDLSLQRRHLRVGGSPGAELEECDCAMQVTAIEGYRRKRAADVTTRKSKLNKALIKAAFEGYERKVRYFIDLGADVNAQMGYWNSALEAACRYGHRRIVLALLQNGANVNENGGMPLYIACEFGHESVASLLIEHGANVNAEIKKSTPLLAAASLKSAKSLVQLLISKGADVAGCIYLPESRLITPLMVAIKKKSDSAPLLIEHGADVNMSVPSQANAKFATPLQLASALGNVLVTRLLIDKGADINATGGSFHTALQAASYEDHELICRTLIINGADINAVGGRYGCPLQAASVRGNYEVVRLLLKKGADVDAHGGRYGSALEAAVRRGNKRITRLLILHGANMNNVNEKEKDFEDWSDSDLEINHIDEDDHSTNEDDLESDDEEDDIFADWTN